VNNNVELTPQPYAGYTPQWNSINSITLGQQTVIGFVNPNEFVPGGYISLRVPNAYGTFQLNNLRGKVLVADSISVTVDIDSTNWSTFIYPVSAMTSPAIAIPSASGVRPGDYVPTMILNDAFDVLPPDEL